MRRSSHKNLALSTPGAMAFVLSEGNIGAYTTLLDIIEGRDEMDMALFLLGIDDLNMRGEQIWVAYKFCKQDEDRFIDTVLRRDVLMINYVNEECLREQGEQVFSGASYARR